MGISFGKKHQKVLPYRLLIWSVVLVVVILQFLNNRPITLSEDVALSQGVEITRTGDSDVVVLLDYRAIRQSGPTFSQRDFSAAWINLFEREIGPVSVTTPETLGEEHLDRSRVLVLTHSVSADLPGSLLDRVREFALAGGVVVVNRPEGKVRQMFSADGAAGPRRGRSITHVADLEERFAEQLEKMPLLVHYVGSTSPRDGARTLLAIDGAPVIYSMEFGEGRVITIDFDLPRQLVALQQGLPDEDFRLPRDERDETAPVHTDDLVADESLRGNPIPFADLLGRFVVRGVLVRYAGLPTFWLYPDGVSGAISFVHEDGRLGDHSVWKLEYERQFGATSTLLTTVDSGLTDEGAQKIRGLGGQIGFAWRRGELPDHLFEPIGLLGFDPLRRPMRLQAQLEALREEIGDPLPTSRCFDASWSNNWAQPHAALAQAGFGTDVSYESRTHRGYAFGSGLPFLPLDEEGIPLAIRQYPVVASARATEGPAMEQLLAESADGHHQLITVATRPSDYADYPDMERFEAWRGLLDSIDQWDHRIMTVDEFEGFQRMRRAGSIRSRLDRHTTLPAALSTEETGSNPRATLLRVAAEVHQGDIYLVIPAHIGSTTFYGALRGYEQVAGETITEKLDTEEDWITGFPVRRLRLEQGFSRFEFYYR